MRKARRPVAFKTADGSPMKGGEELTQLRLRLHNRDSQGKRDETVEIVDEFYNADIHYDLILSYPTLAEHKMGVLPHRNTLVKEDGEGDPLTRWGERVTDSESLQKPTGTTIKIQNVKIFNQDDQRPCPEHLQQRHGLGSRDSAGRAPLNRTRKGCPGSATLTFPTWDQWCGPGSGGSVEALAEHDSERSVENPSERVDSEQMSSSGSKFGKKSEKVDTPKFRYNSCALGAEVVDQNGKFL